MLLVISFLYMYTESPQVRQTHQKTCIQIPTLQTWINTQTHTHSLFLSHTHTLSLLNTHKHTHTHTHTHSLSLSLSLSRFHSPPLSLFFIHTYIQHYNRIRCRNASRNYIGQVNDFANYARSQSKGRVITFLD